MPSILDEAAAEQVAMSTHQRFVVMDGLRGIAAMAVVLLHSFLNRGFVPNGQLAVDLFFILSGFVIAFSYEHRLQTTMTRRQFALARFIRLYPMLFIGALGGVIIALIHNRTNPTDVYPLAVIATSGALSLLVLPYLGPEVNTKAFSFNPPIWSLFFELIANGIYVIFFRRLTIRILAAIVVISLSAVGFAGPLGGGGKAGIWTGLPRVGAGFFGGVLLLKLWKDNKLPVLPSNIFVLGVVILAIFCAPIDIGGWLYIPTFLILLLVVLASINSKPSKFGKFCEFIGLVSYPVYLTHWLTLYVFTFLGAKVGLSGSRYYIVALIHVAAVPFIGFVIATYYEAPVRLWLKRMTSRPLARGVRVNVAKERLS